MPVSEEGLSGENRLLAALAHASIVVQGLGVVVGILVYLTHREKSRYTAFQALQASVYQIIGLLVAIVLWIVWGIFYAISFIPVIQNPELYDNTLPPLFLVALGSSAIPFAVMIVLAAYGLWGSVRTLQGKDFRYILLGGMVEKTMK